MLPLKSNPSLLISWEGESSIFVGLITWWTSRIYGLMWYTNPLFCSYWVFRFWFDPSFFVHNYFIFLTRVISCTAIIWPFQVYREMDFHFGDSVKMMASWHTLHWMTNSLSLDFPLYPQDFSLISFVQETIRLVYIDFCFNTLMYFIHFASLFFDN